MRAFKSNPFVVLADITIALCFIFAVYAVCMTALNSNLRLFYDREQRQAALSKQLEVELIGWHLRHYGKSLSLIPTTKAIMAQNGSSVTQHYSSFRTTDDSEIAQIWMNASFMRISVFQPLFRSGSHLHVDESQEDEFKTLYSTLASVLSSRRGEFNYVYLHGITEAEEYTSFSQSARRRFLERLPREAWDSTSRAYGLSEDGQPRNRMIEEILRTERQEWSRMLSVERASKVFNMLQSERIIASYVDGETARTGLIAKYVIPYGTGVALYTRASMDVGRVDILVFFGDVRDDVNNGAVSDASQ